MNVVLERLTEVTGKLMWAAGVDPTSLAEMRAMVAASLITDNPGGRPLANEAGVEPEIWEAAEAGGRIADRAMAAGSRLRFAREDYLAVHSAAERSTMVFGPFIDADGELVQFSIFESVHLVKVVATLRFGALFDTRETVLLVPQGTTAGDAADSFTLPAGTVWIRARFLVRGAAGFVALRIAGGELVVHRAGTNTDDPDTLVLPNRVAWTLTVEPEQPPPATADGSDGNAVTVRLPSELRVHSTNPPVVAGALEVSGFGETLRFDTPTGAAVAGGDAVAFPYEPGGQAWNIAANRSALFALHLDDPAPVSAAAWAVPLVSTPVEEPEEARHGGSVSVLLSGGPSSRVNSVAGAAVWQHTGLVADADGIEMAGQSDTQSMSVDFALWNQVRSAVTFGGPDVAWLRHASRRGGADVVVFRHGWLVNRWDLPAAATGTPFPFEGKVGSLQMYSEPAGMLRAHCDAEVPEVPDQICGYALENLYLHVRPPRSIAFAGSGTSPWNLADGHARQLFDVRVAQPMLPDPYAANWQIEHLDVNEQRSALGVTFSWVDHQRPWMQAEFTRPISLPAPPPDAGGAVIDRSSARGKFQFVTGTGDGHLALLDLSCRDHQFGIAVRPHRELAGFAAQIDEHNRMALPLHQVQLFMQPQTHWEPVHVVPNVLANINSEDWVTSTTHGGPTLVAAYRDRRMNDRRMKRVPALPGQVAAEIVDVFLGDHRAAALFALPFGLQAYVDMSLGDGEPVEGRFLVSAALHGHAFVDDPDDVFLAAAYLRLIALGDGVSAGPQDSHRLMPGAMSQTEHLRQPNRNGLKSVLSDEVMNVVNQSFESSVPLHQVDLSGFGLSAFSDWRTGVIDTKDVIAENTGVTTVRFDVVVGRTAYEVIQLQSRLWAPQARVVRTIILERGNSGIVHRTDSGWVAVEEGDCTRYAAIDTGVVQTYRNIRNIRILDKPLIDVDGIWKWQEVRYDADVVLNPRGAGIEGQVATIRDHQGYVQITPVDNPALPHPNPNHIPGAKQFAALMRRVGHPIGGGIDATIRLGGTLAMQLSHLEVALARTTPPDTTFVLAVSGTPTLPHAARWTAVAIDGTTKDVSAVDPRHGVPVVRRRSEANFVFRHAADAYDPAATEHGFLMVTDTARVLFPSPRIDPSARGTLKTQPPLVADPSALAHASGEFPRPPFALQCTTEAEFTVSPQDQWNLPGAQFNFTAPTGGIAQGSDWSIERQFEAGRRITITVDSANQLAPWGLAVTNPDTLGLNVAGFPGRMLAIISAFEAAATTAAGFNTPTIELGPALREVQDIVDALKAFVEIGFDIDVNVTAGHGPTPSFVVRLHMALRLPGDPTDRVDIGVGKFRGEFTVDGTLEAAPSGVSRSQLAVALRGDLQQAIFPAVFVGGQFLFQVAIEDDKALVKLGAGVVASLGGELIKGLIELEGTVSYGYTLVPETLRPGVMLGLDVRATLLSGLLGVSFGVHTMAQIARLPGAIDDSVTIWAELRVAATVQVAWAVEETWDIHTQFEQELPLAPFAVAFAGAGLPLALAAAAL